MTISAGQIFEPSTMSSQFGFHSALILLFVLIIMLLALRGILHLKNGSKFLSNPSRIRLIESKKLGRKGVIVLIIVDGEKFLLGITESTVQLLHRYVTEEI